MKSLSRIQFVTSGEWFNSASVRLVRFSSYAALYVYFFYFFKALVLYVQ